MPYNPGVFSRTMNKKEVLGQWPVLFENQLNSCCLIIIIIIIIIVQKEAEKKLKYKSLCIDIQ